METTELAQDMMVGATKISRFLGVTRRQIYSAVERGDMPLFKIGALVCARKSALTKWIERQESAVIASPSESSPSGEAIPSVS
nr:DNA-binding protein [uncultured Devosia sp.]